MHKTHFMSHANVTAKVTLPMDVVHLEQPGHLHPFSRKDIFENPKSETREFCFVEDRTAAPNGPFDPWQLRDDFLSWPIDDWEGFIAMAGRFGPFRISKRSFGLWQKVLREALIRPAREWKALQSEYGIPDNDLRLTKPLRIAFAWDGDVPRAYIPAIASLEAIIATIQIDKLQGAEFRVCARHDCKNPPFRVEARHKIFCDSSCAHLVAVRKSRERAPQAKSKATKKEPKRKRRG
jgi:hypothetical protein